MKHQKRMRCTLAALCAAILLPDLTASAQTITNPSFEAEDYTNSNGYANTNGGVITGWAISDPGKIGLNPAAASPFANNGAIPNGAQVAFIQNNTVAPNAGLVFLETDITGLTIGTKYKVTFRINARSQAVLNIVDARVFTHAVGDATRTPTNTPVAMRVNRVASAVNTVPYKFAAYEFTATAVTETLTVQNRTLAGDHTLLVDDFTIAPSSSAWSFAPMSGDATSGVDSTYTYTHAYTFGGSNWGTVVNGVGFTSTRGANPSIPGKFTTSGFPATFGDASRSVTGSSNILVKSFIYNGVMNINILGLQPSTSYVATVYGVAFDLQPYARSATFVSSLAPTDRLTVDLDQYNQTNGIRVNYAYTTGPADTSVTLTFTATGDGTFHTSGFSNRTTAPAPAPGPNPWSYTAWNGNGTSGVNSDATYTHAFNFGSANSPVINGVTFTGVAPVVNVSPVGAGFTTNNFASVFNGDANVVTTAGGGSGTMATDFVYNGFAGRLNLTGLIPGKEYLLSLFSVGWDGVGARQALFSGPAGFLQIDQDAYNVDNGIRMDYRYVADSTGTLTVTTSPLQEASIHLYGFSNREFFFNPHLQIIDQPVDAYVTAVGAPATFSVFADGAAPLTYQWRKGITPVDIPGETNATLTIPSVSAADVGTYSVAVTGSAGQGTITSNNVKLILATDPVPGLFDTGVGNNCTVLPDGNAGNPQADPHYTIITNPDGDSFIPAIVHDSTTFPLSWTPPAAGPWFQNSATSKWIAPRFNTVSSAGEGVNAGEGPGVYVYETTFDLTGFDLTTVRIMGGWATDNLGVKIRVNGVDVPGLTNGAQFPVLTNFTIPSSTAAFSPGVNTLQFFVQNQTVTPGYTGLRVQGLRGFGVIPPATAPHVAVNPVNTVLYRNVPNCIAMQASGSATLTYQWYKVTTGGPFLIPGATGNTLSGVVTTPAEAAQIAGDYYCVVTNGTGSATSATATITVFNNLPVAANDALAAGKNTAATIHGAFMAFNDSDADNDTLTTTAVSAASAQGGTVALAGGIVTYTPPNNFTGADSFTYTVSDGWGGTATGTVNITVYNGPLPDIHDFVHTSTPVSQDFRFRGIPGVLYHFERATDLVNWADVDSATAPANGIIEFQDAAPPAIRSQYRISWTTP